MPSLLYTTSTTEQDLHGIIELQKNNLPAHLTEEEISSQGFLTVVHSLEHLKKMNDIEQHIICKDGDKVIAYVLAMTIQSKDDLPILKTLFETFEKVLYLGQPVSSFHYIIVGQACVDKIYRGQGILDKCYELYKNKYEDRYDFAITEIACRNTRSIKAHLRIGFSEVFIYTSPDQEDWSIVIWDW